MTRKTSAAASARICPLPRPGAFWTMAYRSFAAPTRTAAAVRPRLRGCWTIFVSRWLIYCCTNSHMRTISCRRNYRAVFVTTCRCSMSSIPSSARESPINWSPVFRCCRRSGLSSPRSNSSAYRPARPRLPLLRNLSATRSKWMAPRCPTVLQPSSRTWPRCSMN